MSYLTTTIADFSILKNGVDSQLEIIQHNDSGFYNITKTAKMIAKLTAEQPGTYAPSRSKCETARDWFKNDSTNQLIAECKRATQLDVVRYELAKGTPKQFAGTYVHRLLYDHFLAWLDPTYAIRVSIILDQIHQEANRKLLQEKDCKIEELKQTLAEFKEESRLRDEAAKARDEAAKARDEAQSAEIQQLLSYAKNTTTELSGARTEIRDNTTQIEKLTDKVQECREVIIERMEDHVLNPESLTKRQYFACLQHPKYCDVLYAIRSQMSNIKKQIKAHKGWDVLIKPIEDPNSIKMFNRFKDRIESIKQEWKSELRMQYREEEINGMNYRAKLKYIEENPLVTINRNNVQFDSDRITIEQIIKLMRDTIADRFKLNVP